jgi:hypothetical protein
MRSVTIERTSWNMLTGIGLIIRLVGWNILRAVEGCILKAPMRCYCDGWL